MEKRLEINSAQGEIQNRKQPLEINSAQGTLTNQALKGYLIRHIKYHFSNPVSYFGVSSEWEKNLSSLCTYDNSTRSID